MPRILVLEFWPLCHLGEIARSFDAHGALVDHRRLEKGDPLPAAPGGWDGLVMMGGAQNAEDDGGWPFLARAAALARAFHDDSRPVLGVCLGGQLLARALGARVRRQGFTELGFARLEPTGAAHRDPLLAGIGPVHVVEYHEDSFDIPPAAVRLLTGAACVNQAFRLGASYGFQCHFECSAALWRQWLAAMGGESRSTGLEARRAADFARHEAGQLAFCATVSARWLSLVEAGRRRREGAAGDLSADLHRGRASAGAANSNRLSASGTP